MQETTDMHWVVLEPSYHLGRIYQEREMKRIFGKNWKCKGNDTYIEKRLFFLCLLCLKDGVVILERKGLPEGERLGRETALERETPVFLLEEGLLNQQFLKVNRQNWKLFLFPHQKRFVSGAEDYCLYFAGKENVFLFAACLLEEDIILDFRLYAVRVKERRKDQRRDQRRDALPEISKEEKLASFLASFTEGENQFFRNIGEEARMIGREKKEVPAGALFKGYEKMIPPEALWGRREEWENWFQATVQSVLS